ncbi:MAG TPA: hypothetical protein DCM07_02785 [Planctomycetaceae bacterium]|uniref:hypothetical protein n=1 Tax=Gimesia sp. TaxID=2024833 RepID=UPI000EDBCC66|nr:hypothetical protein [Planctomycetaceae bacterium]
MGARQRLNSLNLLAVLMISAIIGGVVQSWLLFLISAVALAAILIHSGDIRPTSRSSRKTRQRR